MLLPSELGVFAIATTISGVLWMLGGGQGMAGALIRRPTPPDRADLRVYVGLQLAIMIALAAAAALATLPFGRVGEITAVMVAVTPISAFRGAGVVTIERQLLYRKLATAETSELLVYYGWSSRDRRAGLGPVGTGNGGGGAHARRNRGHRLAGANAIHLAVIGKERERVLCSASAGVSRQSRSSRF